MPTLTETPTSKTLSQRLSEGRLPVPEVLRYAQSLGEALRRLHERGVVHGAICPSNILLKESAVELCAADTEPGVTPYTAPEVLAGRVVDTTSDIFSFGAVVYEMLTGRKAFDGSTPTELVASIVGGQPAPTGSPAVDRLMEICLTKDPAARCQRIQRVLIELRFLANGRRNRASRSSRREAAPSELPPAPFADEKVRNDLQHLETRLSARITTFEDRIGETVRAAAENLAVMRVQIAAAANGIGAPRSGYPAYDAAAERAVARVQSAVNAAMERIAQLEESVTRSTERLQTAEDGLAATRKRLNDLHSAVADDFISFEETLKQHASSIESTRTAIAQNDDLMERVVDTIENLRGGLVRDAAERAVAIIH